MKIKIEQRYSRLMLLNKLFDTVLELEKTHPNEIQFTKEYRANKNILENVFVKIKKKLITKENTPKPIKFSLEYYEVFALVKCIDSFICIDSFVVDLFEDKEQHGILRVLYMELHQKL